MTKVLSLLHPPRLWNYIYTLYRARFNWKSNNNSNFPSYLQLHSTIQLSTQNRQEVCNVLYSVVSSRKNNNHASQQESKCIAYIMKGRVWSEKNVASFCCVSIAILLTYKEIVMNYCKEWHMKMKYVLGFLLFCTYGFFLKKKKAIKFNQI